MANHGVNMASGYRHVTHAQRYTIQVMRRTGTSFREIAAAIGVSASTVCREISRNGGRRGYRHKQAQAQCEQRQEYRTQPRKFTPSMQRMIERKLRSQWSPEQIHGECVLTGIDCVSTERIYQHIWEDKRKGGTLHTHLRSGHRLRRKRYGSKNTRGIIPHRRPISSRPRVVDRRQQFGHWEADTMIGKQHKQALVTIVERTTLMTRIKHVPRKTAALVAHACITLLAADKDCVRTITTDNGKEFAEHQHIEHSLQAKVYFADPYSAWQRGTNENINGLIRQFIPKSRSLHTLTPQEVRRIENKLNNRPRKKLGYRTPNQLYSLHKNLVALRS